jgi:Resolvase, N terminal domain
MLADIRNGKIQPVVAWHLDRLHRRPVELEDFIALADEKRVALATVTGDVDLSTDNGRLIVRLTGAVARAEVEQKSPDSSGQPFTGQSRAAYTAAVDGPMTTRFALGTLDRAPSRLCQPSDVAQLAQLKRFRHIRLTPA